MFVPRQTLVNTGASQIVNSGQRKKMFDGVKCPPAAMWNLGGFWDGPHGAVGKTKTVSMKTRPVPPPVWHASHTMFMPRGFGSGGANARPRMVVASGFGIS